MQARLFPPFLRKGVDGMDIKLVFFPDSSFLSLPLFRSPFFCRFSHEKRRKEKAKPKFKERVLLQRRMSFDKEDDKRENVRLPPYPVKQDLRHG